MPTLNVPTAHFGKVSSMPTSLKTHCKYRYSQKSGYRITTKKDHTSHCEEKPKCDTMPCRRHVINRSTSKKFDLIITTIFKIDIDPSIFHLFYTIKLLPTSVKSAFTASLSWFSTAIKLASILLSFLLIYFFWIPFRYFFKSSTVETPFCITSFLPYVG